MVKNPPAKQEMQVLSLDQEDHLKEEMTIHSNILAWEIPWTEEPGWATVQEVTKSPTGLSDGAHTHNKNQGSVFAILVPVCPSNCVCCALSHV